MVEVASKWFGYESHDHLVTHVGDGIKFVHKASLKGRENMSGGIASLPAMYMHMYTCMSVHIYVCLYVCMHVCMYVRTYVCMYVCSSYRVFTKE